jgi:hypothetical protein
MREKLIYTLTQICNEQDTRSRCQGWFSTLKSAKKTIVDNSEILNEDGYYRFLVIEQIPEGISIGLHKEWWFVWDEDNEVYVKTAKPDALRHIIHFSM